LKSTETRTRPNSTLTHPPFQQFRLVEEH